MDRRLIHIKATIYHREENREEVIWKKISCKVFKNVLRRGIEISISGVSGDKSG